MTTTPPTTHAAATVHDEWTAVAQTLAAAPTYRPPADDPGTDHPRRPPVPEAPTQPRHVSADLRLAMGDGGARRDLRRILIAYGAIGKVRPDGSPGTPARPEDVIGAFMQAPAPVIESLLRGAGAIRDEARLGRFVAAIAAAGADSDPADPVSVTDWITAVGAILRDDGSA